MEAKLQNFSNEDLFDLALGISILTRCFMTATNEKETLPEEAYPVQKVIDLQLDVIREIYFRTTADEKEVFTPNTVLKEEKRSGEFSAP